MASMGHLFIINGDLNLLACDAVLVPTDQHCSIRPKWGRLLGWPDGESGPRPVRPGGWFSERELTFKLSDKDSDKPAVWMTNVASDESRERAVEAFLDAAADDLDCECPRLALPVVGTARGGARFDKGGVLDWLVPMLMDHVAMRSVDVVLITHGWKYYSAAQRIRSRFLDGDESRLQSHWDFGPATVQLYAAANRLAQSARDGQLVPFIGAGVGVNTPSWHELLEHLFMQLGDGSGAWETIQQIPDLRDQAELIAREYEKHDRSLTDEVAKRLAVDRYSVSHGLLASLRTSEAVTTNYDRLYELAVEGAVEGPDDGLAVLPYQAVDSDGSGRWLLKLHGCVSHPEDIVLTREDYLGMPARSAALFGITQAMLITRHMLFIGYSLEDDSFHKVVHEVRQAARDGSSPSLGTAIFLDNRPHLTELFDDLEIVSMDAEGEADLGARRVEIFLDLLAYLSSDMSQFLLDSDYSAMLDPAERAMADALNAARDALDDGPTAERVRAALKRFGNKW